jgi:photosystem II stability/assembly factor-like uncharacterized protein
MKRLLALAIAASFLAVPLHTRAADSPSPSQQLMSKLRWRSIGPYIGGRVVAVAGVAGNQNLFYMGGVEGGVWKSTDYGETWTNISDGKIPGIADPIGALAVAPSNPNVIYAGSGEADIRSDFDTGDGVYKTTDAGKTWSYAGLRDTHMTTKIAIDPSDPNVVYVASMGHVFKPNPQRGVFKTTNGGKTWRKVLFVDENTGGVDLVMDSRNSKVLYAAMWQAQRVPWKLTSGGPGSGLYKTTDGGAHWNKISTNPGFAAGPLGKIGVSVAARDPRIVYAIVQAREGGVFRSNDAGTTWKRVNSEMKLRQRAFYYTAIFVDPTNPQVAYAPEVDGIYKTTDGGKTFNLINLPHGDNHIVWINPRNPKILLVGNDGGATVSVDGGDNWSSDRNQPTGQYYHVALDQQFPFHVFGAAQDEGAYEGPSAALGPDVGEHAGIGPGEWHSVALGESTFVAPDPDNVLVTYGSGYYSSFVRLNRVTGDVKNVSPWPRYMAGASSGETAYRFGWTHPIFFSPADPRELLVAAQVVFSSMDRGQTWKIISPDLTRNDPSTEGPSGGPVSYDQTGAETFPDISSLAVSPLDANVLWAGSADGLVHVTTDHGAHWTAVTPPQLPQWAQISSIEPSHNAKGTAYLTASRYMWDDYHPYLYETTDYGAHWTTLTNGLPADQYVFAVRQDPSEPRLLFAGTRSTVYVSLDGGLQWQPLTLNLPGVQVRDLAIDTREGELVAATHGRAFWILDNIALLEQLARQTTLSVGGVQLFAPETAWLSQAYGGRDFPIRNFGENPKYGAAVFFNLPASYNGQTAVTLSFLDGKGAVVRSFTLHPKEKHEARLTPGQEANLDATQDRERELKRLTSVKPGMNVFQWDLRYAPAFDPPGFRTVGTDDFPDTSDGPTIVPGKYTVELQYGGQTLQAPLTVALDPRIHPAPGDLEARLALEMQVLDTMDGLDRAIAAAMTASRKLPPSASANVNSEVADLIQLDIHSSEGDVLHETKIREQLGFLMNSLEGAYARPTAAEYSAYTDLKALASAGETRLQALAKP